MSRFICAWLVVVAALLTACEERSATAPRVPDSSAASAPSPAAAAPAPDARAAEAPRQVFASGPETADPALAAFVEKRLLELHGHVWDELHATASERRKAREVVLESLRRTRSLEDREFSARISKDDALREFMANEEWESAQYVSIFGKERADERARIQERLQREQLDRVEPDVP